MALHSEFYSFLLHFLIFLIFLNFSSRFQFSPNLNWTRWQPDRLEMIPIFDANNIFNLLFQKNLTSKLNVQTWALLRLSSNPKSKKKHPKNYCFICFVRKSKVSMEAVKSTSFEYNCCKAPQFHSRSQFNFPQLGTSFRIKQRISNAFSDDI